MRGDNGGCFKEGCIPKCLQIRSSREADLGAFVSQSCQHIECTCCEKRMGGKIVGLVIPVLIR